MATAEKLHDIDVEHLEAAYDKPSSAPAPTDGDVKLVDADGNVRRIPVPSSDPNDPLNMNKWRKAGIVVTCCWFSIFSLVLVGGAGPILEFWMQEYTPQGMSTQDVVNLTTYPSLVMALGAFVILPLSVVFGRRPVLLACTLLLLGSTIGAAVCQSYDTHMACRILQGIAAGATESVLPLVITDISFIDERGLLFGFYWGAQSCVNAVFTITVSYLAQNLGWRWFYWLMTILNGLGCMMVFFCLPETRYTRSSMSIGGQMYYTDEFGVTLVISEEEARANGITEAPAVTSPESKRTYVQSLNPVSTVAPNGFMLAISVVWKILSSLSSPAVVWAILATSITLGVGISMSLTYGLILTGGYSWPQGSVGLINCGILPIALIAMFWSGWLGDKTNVWLAKRRNGTHIPEDSLVILIVPTIVCMIGIIIYALAADKPESYSVWAIIMGWTLQQFGFVVSIITSTHFASEAYPSNPGPALVLVVGMKNIVSFGATYGILPMVHTWNYLTAYMLLFGVFTGIYVLGIPIYFFNPKV
ncbi:hypothetical protein WHR41_07439 [Cladosporium halotolerans]|uniref:Major facilitator superfamily (MFS) profile domain-containing protein n=1 Tax=Cladosporium halotolerans TaxID=1052096 RepID=A0AB34KFK5_9PEZI